MYAAFKIELYKQVHKTISS